MKTDRKKNHSMKRGHRRIQRLLSAYICGELDGKTAERVERHLEECTDCARALQREKELHRSLTGVLAHRAIDPAHDITGAVLGKIRERETQESIADRISKVFDMRFRPAAVYALAASIGLAVGILPLFTFLAPSAAVAETEADPLAIEYLMDAPPQSLTAFYFDGEVTDE
jgi:anti-sigma factor RsiW